MAFASFCLNFVTFYFRYTNPHKKDDRRKARVYEKVGTSFPGTWMLKFRDSKRLQRGCKRKLMVNVKFISLYVAF